MLAQSAQVTSSSALDANARFLEMLPTICQVANYAFRFVRRAAREELVAEVVANAFVAFQGLVRRGKIDLAYHSVLAWFGVRQVRAGRRVGERLNVGDVMSPYAQQKKQFQVCSSSSLNSHGRWEELVIEDKHSTPADLAACRLDFRAWLSGLNRTKRAVALRLATGEGTTDAARRFRVSRARISQVRQELKQSWQVFQGEQVPVAA